MLKTRYHQVHDQTGVGTEMYWVRTDLDVSGNRSAELTGGELQAIHRVFSA